MLGKFIEADIVMVKFTNNSAIVMGKINQMTDLMMSSMAAGIEIQIKTSGDTPIDKGHLRSSARNIKIGNNHYEVVDTAGYAAAQEVGHMTVSTQRVVTPDRGKTFFTLKPGVYDFKKHPRGGGAHYFTKAIARVIAREGEYAKTAIDAVGLEAM
jgi:hypothetical protein